MCFCNKTNSFVVKIRTNPKVMTRTEQIEKQGYCVFTLTKSNDGDSMTPISAKYQLIMVCTEGESILDANMQQIKIEKGDCLCFNNVLYKKTISMSNDFKAKVLVCDRSFAFDAIVGIPIGYVELIYTMPLVKVEDHYFRQLIENHFDNLELLQYKQLELRHKEVVSSILRSLVIMMVGLRGGNDSMNLKFSQADVYFLKFVELLESNVKEEHEVTFYAGQLNITAKYLSELCKAKSGYKAKEMISSFLISKIKQEMVMTGKSIKTIAYEYGFADQSSMGKFFTKITGMSPGEFKKTQGV